MTIRVVIFDLGGVLVRTEDRGPRLMLARQYGLTYEGISNLVFENETARMATIGEVTTQDHWEAVRLALNATADELKSVKSGFWKGDRLDTELVEYIRSLRPRYKTGLLSNAWDNLRRVVMEDWKIADAFDDILVSAEIGVAKPDPRIYQVAVERFQVSPQEAVFIDDMPANVQAACEVGLHAIQFKDARQMVKDLEALLHSGEDERPLE
jgi:glucose-1-phosphatase